MASTTPDAAASDTGAMPAGVAPIPPEVAALMAASGAAAGSATAGREGTTTTTSRAAAPAAAAAAAAGAGDARATIDGEKDRLEALKAMDAAAPRLPPGVNPFDEVNDDAAILNYIFDPDKAFIGATMPPPKRSGPKVEEPVDSEARTKAKEHERRAIELATEENAEGALKEANAAVEADPTFPSAYNNRAQVRRMLDDDVGAVEDLTKAIELATAWLDDNEALAETKAAKVQQAVLKQAYSQRAAVHL